MSVLPQGRIVLSEGGLLEGLALSASPGLYSMLGGGDTPQIPCSIFNFHFRLEEKRIAVASLCETLIALPTRLVKSPLFV